MELHELKAFVMVADLMSVNQAAERLRIAQPAMSRKIKKLEQDLGVNLFERKHGRIYLTPAGQVFHHDVPIILHLLDEARSALLRFTPRRPAEGHHGMVLSDGKLMSSGKLSPSG